MLNTSFGTLLHTPRVYIFKKATLVPSMTQYLLGKDSDMKKKKIGFNCLYKVISLSLSVWPFKQQQKKSKLEESIKETHFLKRLYKYFYFHISFFLV